METEFRLASGMAAMAPPRLRELMGRASQAGVLSFAVGLPAVELFPGADLGRAAARLLPGEPEALQYAVPYAPLKARIVELMKMRGVDCRAEEIFLTSGTQQSMDLLARLFLDPGGEVMLEETVYEGVRMALRRWAPDVVSVPTDPRRGIDVAEIARRLEHGARPAFLYTIPSSHNPLGVSLDGDGLQALAALARIHHLPILEDDAYGFLHYDEGPPPPALRSREERWVVYLGSFSKILAPALRAGWIVAPAELIDRLSALKHAADLDTPAFSHRLISAYLERADLAAHLAVLRAEYRRRRDAMLDALDRHFPPAVRWNRPSGGMFVWVELPAGADASALLETALAGERIAFTPGVAFVDAGQPHAASCLRLCFTAHPPERIADGVRRLGNAVESFLGRGSGQ